MMKSDLANKLLSVLLALLVLATISVLVYLLTTPRVSAKFTEFYILDTGGKAADYPRYLARGETGTVIVGIANREQETVAYTVEVVVNGQRQKTVGPLSLQNGGEWREGVTFAPVPGGGEQKVEFILYRSGEGEPYRGPLFLWVTVR